MTPPEAVIPDSVEAIRLVAIRLGPQLVERVVFLGGATVGLLVTDPGAPPPRGTTDVDVVVEVTTLGTYSITLRDELLSLGFREDASEGAPMCRWLVDGIKVDVMPTEGRVLGFRNPWYLGTITHAVTRDLGGGTSIRLVSGPYFLATKFDAFRDRGKGDYQASHDIEDIVAVVDGRREIEDEVTSADDEVRAFLRAEIAEHLSRPAFADAIAGHLPGDAASQGRLSRVVALLERLADR